MTARVASLLKVTGIGHTLLGVLLFPGPLSSMAHEGFVDTIRYGQFDRATAFWFMLFGPTCFLLGRLVEHAMNCGDRWLLTVVGRNLLAIGVVGALIMPISGFWILIAIAPFVFHMARALVAPHAAAGSASGV